MRGGEVLLGEHLHRVRERVQEPQDADPEDRRPVGPDTVLHDGGLLALHPGQEPAEVQDHEHDERDRDRLQQQIDRHVAHPFTTWPASRSPR